MVDVCGTTHDRSVLYNAFRFYRSEVLCFKVGQGFFVILGPFGELRHNKGFPLALYSYGVSRNTKKIFHSNRGELSAQNGHALFTCIFSLNQKKQLCFRFE
eukprot:sb/3478515/